ncbi:hypothetical protein QBC37DRAFT_369656 [Rhypophila decipiens]|uniref:Uncharacterized protein n=1 Tax=Rhypophila decipiens TaxID=261697 RepID=A0AAN7BBN0_9PEZI|nr:hypothetical protein QBC37DRAFT_369656 [Rhypophila decipiens]
MPVIPEVDEMDEFINWDNAAPAMAMATATTTATATGSNTDSQYPLQAVGAQHLTDMDLALANVDGDDFSYWALEHFEQTNMGPLEGMGLTGAMDTSATLDMDLADELPTPFEESFEIPDVPCTHCRAGGYQCKRICEGKYKGYCTSCVALRCGCSFGLVASTAVPTDTAFPFNPWPVMGDHPDAITQEGVVPATAQGKSAKNLSAPNSIQGDENAAAGPAGAAKIGARFSRESVKILKNWLSVHHKHPYPNEEEKEVLQKQTGLNKTQITNWLANARRRRKIIAPRSTSPGVRSFSSNIDIPQRRGTPASFDQLNPLQRWQVSPPENEPASVTAIARAVTASASTLSSGLNSPYSLNFTDDGSGKSLCAVSSTSSFNTSHSSGGSFASAFSHGSRGSFGSMGSSMNRGRRRRRRKAVPKASGDKPGLPVPSKTFQCTFCTETFRTKHDWQRHEKSLHLSLERWVCAPNGARAFSPENGQVSCVFCGEANPDEAHIETHNHSACQERTLGERTFYRKDHLRQHLKLVHGAKFVNWSMEQWKVATPEIRSRCGFCGIIMDTWTIRVDHLAEHFKTGNTMADWKGDWGFEAPVLDMVENSIPPYLIHGERNSPNPFEATHGVGHTTARNAYELIKTELMFYIITEHEKKGRRPTDGELQLEACRIVYGAEVLSQNGISSTPSWLRDLLVSSSGQIAMQAQLAPIRTHVDSNQTQLKINGKDNIFEDDPMETELHEFVKARRLLGLTAMDSELQVEACKIIGRMEESSNHPSDEIANFLLRLIYSSTDWLAGFRQRAVLPRSEDVGDEKTRSKDMTKIDSTIHNYSRLESELAEYVRNQRSMGFEPTDADLQKQARIIIYEYDDGWNQTAADNLEWLNAFKQRHVAGADLLVGPSTSPSLSLESLGNTTFAGLGFGSTNTNTNNAWIPAPGQGNDSLWSGGGGGGGASISNSPKGTGSGGAPLKINSVFFADANCYRRLERELGRYVAAAMSPNNPNCHVPTDEELQHQSRWILYDDDDPWNQTAADNVEWLSRFKRDVGILTDPDLPGLPACDGWNATQGGSGFAPPYVYPNPESIGFSQLVDAWSGTGNPPTTATTTSSSSGEGGSLVPIAIQAGSTTRPFMAETSTVNKFLRTAFGRNGRLQKPAQVFCSRELENGLAEYVGAKVAIQEGFPSDDELKRKAREILGIEKTPAEDAVLLGKFKEMMSGRLGMHMQQPGPGPGQQTTSLLTQQMQAQTGQTPPDSGSGSGSGSGTGLSPRSIEMMTDQEVNDILLDLNFEFDHEMDPQAQGASAAQGQSMVSRDLVEDAMLANLDM